jgi:hypothetical protein
MRRLYFLLPNIEVTRSIVDELLLARIEERHIHVIAKEGTPMEDIPEASLLQKSDFIPALEKGVLGGAYTGILAGLVAAAIPASGLVLGGGILAAMTAAGATVGGLMSSMVGISIPSGRLEKFEDAVKAGEILMLVDVPRQRVDKIEELVKTHHPSVDIEGTEPMVPPFP